MAWAVHDNLVTIKGQGTSIQHSEDKHEKKAKFSVSKILRASISCTTVVCYVHRIKSCNSMFFYVAIISYYIYAGYLQSHT